MVTEFKHDVYELHLDELHLQRFPYPKVLQVKYGDRVVYPRFKKWFEEYLKSKRPILDQNIEEIRKDILNKKYELMLDHPNSFPQRGWYDLKVWRELPENKENLGKYLKKKEEKAKKALEIQDRFVKLRLQEEERKQKRIETILEAIEKVEKEFFTYKDVKVFLKDVQAQELKQLTPKIIWVKKHNIETNSLIFTKGIF